MLQPRGQHGALVMHLDGSFELVGDRIVAVTTLTAGLWSSPVRPRIRRTATPKTVLTTKALSRQTLP